MLALALSRTAPCASPRALSPGEGFQFTLCGPAPVAAPVAAGGGGCRAFAVSGHGQSPVLDADFVAAMHRAKCPVISVGPAPPILSAENEDAKIGGHHELRWCAGSPAGTGCEDPFAEFQARVRLPQPPHPASGAAEPAAAAEPTNAAEPAAAAEPTRATSLVFVDVSREEWRGEAPPPVLRLLDRLEAETVFLPVRLDAPAAAPGGPAERHLGALLRRYRVASVHANEAEGTFTANVGDDRPGAGSDGGAQHGARQWAAPRELHVTLRRCAGDGGCAPVEEPAPSSPPPLPSI